MKNLNIKYLKSAGYVYQELFSSDIPYLTLSEFAIFPEEAANSLEEMFKLHFGYSTEEMNEITGMIATNSINRLIGFETTEIPPEKVVAVEEYHKILFGDYVKDEDYSITK